MFARGGPGAGSGVTHLPKGRGARETSTHWRELVHEMYSIAAVVWTEFATAKKPGVKAKSVTTPWLGWSARSFMRSGKCHSYLCKE